MFNFRRFERRIFSSLEMKNFRRYFYGQAISMCGNWMQSIAQSWLILQLTGSGTALGVVIGLQFLPMFLFSPFFGITVDRYNKRAILYVTQSLSAIIAIALSALVFFGVIQIWMVYIFALVLGLINALDNPTRQVFTNELVGPNHLSNAIALVSAEANLARIIGPALGGIVITTFGLAACFFLNGLSFFAVIVMLTTLKTQYLYPSPRNRQHGGQLKAGLLHAWQNYAVRIPLLMMILIGTFSFEYVVALPIFASREFSASIEAYAALSAWMGVGALLGSFYVAEEGKAPIKTILYSSFFLGIATLCLARSSLFLTALISVFFVGFCAAIFTSMTNASIQLHVSSEMRGRVISLWTVAFLGSTVIGGPFVGWLAENYGARWGLAVGGLAAIIAAFYGYAHIHLEPFKLSKAQLRQLNAE